jgi:hypothetical protein
MRLVKAIEHRTGQTESARGTAWRCGVVDPFTPPDLIRGPLERGAKEGDSPVGAKSWVIFGIPE